MIGDGASWTPHSLYDNSTSGGGGLMSFDSELYAKKVPWVKRAGIVAFVGALLLPILGACGQRRHPTKMHMVLPHSASSSTTHSRRVWISVLRGRVRETSSSSLATYSIMREEGKLGTPQGSAPRTVETPPLPAMSSASSLSSSIVDRSQAKACSTVLRSWVEAKLSPSRS